MYLNRNDWRGRTDLGDFEHGMSAGTYFSRRDYETAAEKKLSIAVAAELRPVETLPPAVRPRLRKKDQPSSGFDVLILKPTVHEQAYVAQMIALQKKFEACCPRFIPLVRSWTGSLVMAPANRPTGQIVLVPPTPRTIPYGVVSVVGPKKTDTPHLEEMASTAFGIAANQTPGDALDRALSRRTFTSLDKNFETGKGIWSSEEPNWDGDDVAEQEPTESVTMHSASDSVIEHVVLGKTYTMNGLTFTTPAYSYFEKDSEHWNIDAISLLSLKRERWRAFVALIVLRYLRNRDKSIDSDATIADSIRREWSGRSQALPAMVLDDELKVRGALQTMTKDKIEGYRTDLQNDLGIKLL
jgi:hypothetical protein